MTAYPQSAITERIIGCAIEVHAALGPGLLESAYQKCLSAEFRHQNIRFKSQVAIPIIYRYETIAISYRLDFVVDNKVIVELKAVDSVTSLVTAQILTYLKLTNIPLALLINFNSVPLRTGIKRFINKSQ